MESEKAKVYQEQRAGKVGVKAKDRGGERGRQADKDRRNGLQIVGVASS